MIFRKIIPLAVAFVLVFNPGLLQAKANDDQEQIILLNDSAAALEDSNPGLSKSLTKFADEKEKVWDDKNANKSELPAPITDKTKAKLQERIVLLRTAAGRIEPTYPLIAKALNKMAKDMNRTIEIEK